jgi:hypothetical protein
MAQTSSKIPDIICPSGHAQDSLGRRHGVVDLKVSENLQLRETVFKDRLDDPQPIVTQIDSMSRRHIAKNIQSRGWLCPPSLRAVRSAVPSAVPTGERESLE